MLQNARPDAVVIATPPDSHLELALACIEAGVHLLIEKPLAPTAVEAERIVQAADAHGVRIAVNYEKRFHPSLARVGELLRRNSIGVPYFAGVHWAATVKLAPESFIPAGFERGYRWRWSNKTIGGGIVQDHLPHYLDLFRHWTGSTPISVYAHTFNVARDYLRWSPEDSVWEDFGIILTRFSNDLVVRLETGTTGRSLSPVWSLGSGIGEWTEYGYVLGTKGQLLFDLLPWDSSENGRVVLWELDRSLQSGTGWTFLEQPEPARREGSPAGAAHEMFSRQLREFAQLVRGESTNIAVGFDGVLGVAAVEAAYQSAKTRQECNLSTKRA
jgi:predicted dehydrogenase